MLLSPGACLGTAAAAADSSSPCFVSWTWPPRTPSSPFSKLFLIPAQPGCVSSPPPRVPEEPRMGWAARIQAKVAGVGACGVWRGWMVRQWGQGSSSPWGDGFGSPLLPLKGRGPGGAGSSCLSWGRWALLLQGLRGPGGWNSHPPPHPPGCWPGSQSHLTTACDRSPGQLGGWGAGPEQTSLGRVPCAGDTETCPFSLAASIPVQGPTLHGEGTTLQLQQVSSTTRKSGDGSPCAETSGEPHGTLTRCSRATATAQQRTPRHREGK